MTFRFTFRFTFLMIGCAAALLAGSNKKSNLAARAPGEVVPAIVRYRLQQGAAHLRGLATKGGEGSVSYARANAISVTLPAAVLDGVRDPSGTVTMGAAASSASLPRLMSAAWGESAARGESATWGESVECASAAWGESAVMYRANTKRR